MKRRSAILQLLLFVALVPVAATALAQPANLDEDARRAQVQAASANAVERLREEIGATRISNSLTVNDFLRQTQAHDRFEQALQRAQQIGGPRWIDDQVCQIQLEITGQQVADALVEIAELAHRTPIRPESLARELRGWRDRSFSATGKSTSPHRVEMLRPVRVGDWERVSDDIRTRAIRTAQQDAARRSLESVRPVELAPGLTVADALARPEVAQRMNQWFVSRPIKTVAFKENLQVDLTLGAPPEETFDELVGALRVTGGVQLDPDSVQSARQAFVQRMAEPVGRASVTRDAIDLQPQPVELPPQPPQWLSRQLDAEGTARAARGQPRLASMREAQEQALQNLRAQVGALPLTNGLTLGDAARKDPRIAQAIDMAMVRARVFKVDYDDADGRTTVRMMIDARDVWNEVSGVR